MPLDGASIHFHLSGAASLLAAQPDPNASLGNYIASASNRLYHYQGTVGTVIFSSHAFIDASLPLSPSRVGDWVLLVTGSGFGSAAQVSLHLNFLGSSLLLVSTPLTGLTALDQYRLHAPNNLFDDVLAAEALTGEAEYRGIFVRNETGVALNAVKMYLDLVHGGAPAPALAVKDGMASQFVGGNLPNENTAPVLSTTLGDANARFEAFFNYDIAYDAGGAAAINNLNQRPAWVRRTVPANMGPQNDVVWRIVVQGTNTGGNPDPIKSCALIVFSGEGFVPQVAMQEDRYVYVGGGARVTATITDEGGNPQEEYDLEWSVVGDGSLDTTTGQTDEDGQNTVAYTAPTSELAEGQSASIVAKVI
jgi:hypothetical protein